MMCVLRGFSPWYRPFESYTKQPAAGLLVGSCVVVVVSRNSIVRLVGLSDEIIWIWFLLASVETMNADVC